jgi:hypothetical protein
MPHRRRIWCETLPAEALAEPRALGLLRRFRLDPILAVWPRTELSAVARALRAARDEGLRPAVWPMLDDRDGRWASASNLGAFARHVEGLTRALAAEGASPSEVAIDLEPSIEAMRPSIAAGPGTSGARAAASAFFVALRPGGRAFVAAQHELATLAAALREGGAAVFAAAPPTVLLDPDEAGAPVSPTARPFQALLGTPIDGVGWDHVSVMLYTSILEGWSRGALRRADARALLSWGAAAARARYGARASASLGAVGVGAFGDEPVYRSPGELADDVAIVTAARVEDLALFDLGGVLRREAPEAWLEAFARPPEDVRLPKPTPRLRALLTSARVVGGALVALGHLAERLTGGAP